VIGHRKSSSSVCRCQQRRSEGGEQAQSRRRRQALTRREGALYCNRTYRPDPSGGSGVLRLPADQSGALRMRRTAEGELTIVVGVLPMGQHQSLDGRVICSQLSQTEDYTEIHSPPLQDSTRRSCAGSAARPSFPSSSHDVAQSPIGGVRLGGQGGSALAEWIGHQVQPRRGLKRRPVYRELRERRCEQPAQSGRRAA
jgi:hypothetical protein